MPRTHKKIDLLLDVAPLREAIDNNPQLFDEFTFRKDNPLSPHREMQDIIFRYNARENFNDDRAKFNEEHDPVWYEGATVIPEVKDIVFAVMAKVRGERLGMVLCTKLPPGGEIAPHIDGGWHAEYYKKYYVAINNKPGATFHFVDGVIEPREGEVYEFDNSETHWVENNSDEDRVSLIVCIRGEL